MGYDISVFIPVYRGSALLGDNLNKLIHMPGRKEIFVIIDEPSDESRDIAERFGSEVKFIINKKRGGKVNALNNAVPVSSGRVLVFLDADISLPQDPAFLLKVLREMEDADILDLRKEVVRGTFLSNMTYYEYSAANFVSWLFSRFSHRTPVINGAGFAIRRDVFLSLGMFRNVVSEDLDLATRAYIAGYRFKYSESVTVYNHVYSTWKDWVKQRKRWSVGTALWIREWYKTLSSYIVRHPMSTIPSAIFLLPLLLIPLLAFIHPEQLVSRTLLFARIYLTALIPPVLGEYTTHLALLHTNMYDTHYSKVMWNMGMFFLCGYLLTSFMFYIFSIRLGFHYNIAEFFIYYLFYSIISLAMMVQGFVRVFILNDKSVTDWVVDSE